MSEPKRLPIRDLTHGGATKILDAATAGQNILILTRREVDVAVVVPVARYARMLRAIKEKGGTP
jgi:antitoxin (DNA-binding transcriptional repressor) of toxin-antitoxin stability system